MWSAERLTTHIISFLTNRAFLISKAFLIQPWHLALVLKLYYNSRITSCEITGTSLKNKMLTLLVSIVTKGIQFYRAGVGCVTFTAGRGHHFTGDLPGQLGAQQRDQMELGWITSISLLTGLQGGFYRVGKFLYSAGQRHTGSRSKKTDTHRHTYTHTKLRRACWVCCLWGRGQRWGLAVIKLYACCSEMKCKAITVIHLH